MKKLIRLELKKFSFTPHLIGLLIANILILFLSTTTSMIMITEAGVPAVTGLPALKLATTDLSSMLTRATMLIWEAALIALLVIEEYRNKTMGLLFTYPVKKSKLIFAKLILICGAMLLFFIFSSIFQNVSILFLSKRLEYVSFSHESPLTQFIIMIATICIGLFPLYIGMIGKSSIKTIVSSIILMALVSNSQGNTAGLLSIPVAAIVFGLLGILFSVFTIKKILRSDM